ncbi:MAG: hypothetical protein H6741_15525 [Alphaproteobacteria bacterium]|nr:hypothetical protein [Alphaproteobacteria bacterium]
MFKLLCLLAGPAFAQDPPPMQVLVPEFTPGSVNELAVAFTMTQFFLDDLSRLGVQPVPADAIATRSGARGEACADNPSCPMDLLGDWPEVPMVVVASVARKGDRLDLRVAFYGPGDGRPISELTELIQPGQELDFTSAMATQANQVLELLYLERGDGPAATWTLPGQEPVGDPVGDPVVVVTPVDDPKDPPVDPVRTDPVVTDPVRTDPVDPPRTDPVNPGNTDPANPGNTDPVSPGLTGDPTGSSGRASGRFLGTDQSHPVTWPTSKPGMKAHAKEMGISYWAYQKFRDSGENDPEVWLRKNRVRSQQMGFEVQTGLISGALDQTMDYRAVMLYNGEGYEGFAEGTQDEFFSQALVAGDRRGTLGFGLAVNFNTHVEFGFNGGLFQSEQCLTRSFNLKSDTHDLDQTQHLSEQCVYGFEEGADGQRQAVLGGYVQPRVRIYPYGLGFVKPYFLGAVTFMVLPGFEMGEQADTRDQGSGTAWSYGTEPGLLPIGFTGGGGLMFDLHYRIGVFLETQYTVYPLAGRLASYEEGYGVSGQDDNPEVRGLPAFALEQADHELPWTEAADVAGLNNLVLSAGVQLRF